MKIAVIGACGRTGKIVCQQALKRGHKVNGLSRDKCGNLGIDFVIGDGLNETDVAKAIKGCDAVISVVGHIKLKEVNTQTRVIKNVIYAMDKHGVKRVVSLTGSGVRIAGDNVSLTDRALNVPLKMVDKSRVTDGINHYHALKRSDLDWTVLRVLKLTNQNKTEDYLLTSGGPAKTTISRKTAAKILVDIAEDNQWIKAAPVVTKK